ncbi:hypothetical protein GGR56DRAFT_669397 [Xylariaceae sp. FL0804]|nr:hypothetical protein GGR56DRAFT_669397 [Xylariaceae sp. FL0804]
MAAIAVAAAASMNLLAPSLPPSRLPHRVAQVAGSSERAVLLREIQAYGLRHYDYVLTRRDGEDILGDDVWATVDDYCEYMIGAALTEPVPGRPHLVRSRSFDLLYTTAELDAMDAGELPLDYQGSKSASSADSDDEYYEAEEDGEESNNSDSEEEDDEDVYSTPLGSPMADAVWDWVAATEAYEQQLRSSLVSPCPPQSPYGSIDEQVSANDHSEELDLGEPALAFVELEAARLVRLRPAASQARLVTIPARGGVVVVEEAKAESEKEQEQVAAVETKAVARPRSGSLRALGARLGKCVDRARLRLSRK